MKEEVQQYFRVPTVYSSTMFKKTRRVKKGSVPPTPFDEFEALRAAWAEAEAKAAAEAKASAEASAKAAAEAKAQVAEAEAIAAEARAEADDSFLSARGLQSYTEDGRRFATPIRSALFRIQQSDMKKRFARIMVVFKGRVAKNPARWEEALSAACKQLDTELANIENDWVWRNALKDATEYKYLPDALPRRDRWQKHQEISRQEISKRKYLFREIDLRGAGIQQQKLGHFKVKVKELPQFVKSITSAATMCGGGGGGGI